MSEAIKNPPQAVNKTLKKRLNFLRSKRIEFRAVVTACENEIKQIENYLDALEHTGEFYED